MIMGRRRMIRKMRRRRSRRRIRESRKSWRKKRGVMKRRRKKRGMMKTISTPFWDSYCHLGGDSGMFGRPH